MTRVVFAVASAFALCLFVSPVPCNGQSYYVATSESEADLCLHRNTMLAPRCCDLDPNYSRCFNSDGTCFPANTWNQGRTLCRSFGAELCTHWESYLLCDPDEMANCTAMDAYAWTGEGCTADGPTASPTMSPLTLRERNDPRKCDAPPYDFMPLHDQDDWMRLRESPWLLDLVAWDYDKKRDATFVSYSLCAYAWAEQRLSSLFIQVPCECELCITCVTLMASPNVFGSERFKGWIWQDLWLEPGECVELRLALAGYAPLEWADFKMFGDRKQHANITLAPNPCHRAKAEDREDPHGNMTDPLDKYLPDNICTFACPEGSSEYEVGLVSREVVTNRRGAQFTEITYELSVDDTEKPLCTLPNPAPGMDGAMPLSDVILYPAPRCHPQGDNFLNTITESSGDHEWEIFQTYWYKKVMVNPGESMQVTLVLEGDVPVSEGVIVLGGWTKCEVVVSALVPNPCINECIFGQWTEWEYSQLGCDVSCGGGFEYRRRDCVSVCDLSEPSENCAGDDFGNLPCNTHQCIDGTTPAPLPGDDIYVGWHREKTWDSSSSSSSDWRRRA